jgi:hypothetical protein
MQYLDTQDQKVYDWLLTGKSITTLEAMNILHIACLTKRISTLIQDYHVPIHKESVPNSSGRGYHGRYSIIKENRELLKDVPLGFAHKYEDVVFWQIGSEPTNLYGALNHE